KLSSYYDGKLFIYEWIRNWIMAVTLDEEGKYVRMEPFLGHMQFACPMDMHVGPEGGLYLLEYGSNWFSKNQNAKLVRITYTEGNRDPIADIQTDKTYGAAPLTINFSATESRDYDKDDELQYEWNIEGQTVTGKEISHTFESRGEHPVLLTVKDGQGGQDTTGTTISVGNSTPNVQINTPSNTSFYWNGDSLDYRITVDDKEVDPVDTSRVHVSFGFLENAKEMPVILSGDDQAGNIQYQKSRQLVNSRSEEHTSE